MAKHSSNMGLSVEDIRKTVQEINKLVSMNISVSKIRNCMNNINLLGSDIPSLAGDEEDHKNLLPPPDPNRANENNSGLCDEGIIIGMITSKTKYEYLVGNAITNYARIFVNSDGGRILEIKYSGKRVGEEQHLKFLCKTFIRYLLKLQALQRDYCNIYGVGIKTILANPYAKAAFIYAAQLLNITIHIDDAQDMLSLHSSKQLKHPSYYLLQDRND